MKGSLEVIAGCMFSGKSEELIRRLRRASIAGQKVLCVKPAIDNRYSDRHAASHSGDRFESVPLDTVDEVTSLLDEERPEVVGIEEAQFFGPDLIALVMEEINRGTRVICAGLDLDSFARPFIPMPELLCRADQVTKLTAICTVCKKEATRSQLLLGGKPAAQNPEPLIVIGALDTYEARCKDCHEVPNV